MSTGGRYNCPQCPAPSLDPVAVHGGSKSEGTEDTGKRERRGIGTNGSSSTGHSTSRPARAQKDAEHRENMIQRGCRNDRDKFRLKYLRIWVYSAGRVVAKTLSRILYFFLSN